MERLSAPMCIASSGLALVLALGGCAPGDPLPSNNNDNQDPQPVAFQLSPSGQAVAIIDPAGFEELLSLSETQTTDTLRPIAERYVRLFGERFDNHADFVLFTIDAHRRQIRFNAVGGFNIAVQVPEAGLGPFVPVSSFSALPSMRSYIYLARKDSLVLGPSLHELAQGWGVHFRAPAALGTQAEEFDNHWGYSSVGGQMGGWMPGALRLRDDGTFILSAGNVQPRGRSFNTSPYAPLELYIMGMLEQQTVEPIEVALNPVPKPGSLFEFSADGITTVTIEDIVEANGARIPDVAQSPKSFEAALVFVTDHELSAREWDFYQDTIDYFSLPDEANVHEFFPEERYAGQTILELLAQNPAEGVAHRYVNFFEATQGRATIRFGVLSAR